MQNCWIIKYNFIVKRNNYQSIIKESSTAVSYTHLDVYKRQPEVVFNDKRIRKLFTALKENIKYYFLLQREIFLPIRLWRLASCKSYYQENPDHYKHILCQSAQNIVCVFWANQSTDHRRSVYGQEQTRNRLKTNSKMRIELAENSTFKNPVGDVSRQAVKWWNPFGLSHLRASVDCTG